MRFTKMHGLGNDFIIFDAPPGGAPDADAIRRLADRFTGIGFDQALMLEPPRKPGTAVYYRIFNADGREVEQCGNGARCIARHIGERGAAPRSELVLDSPGGLVQAKDQSRRERIKRKTSMIWKEIYNEVRQSRDQRVLRSARRQKAEGKRRELVSRGCFAINSNWRGCASFVESHRRTASSIIAFARKNSASV